MSMGLAVAVEVTFGWFLPSGRPHHFSAKNLESASTTSHLGFCPSRGVRAGGSPAGMAHESGPCGTVRLTTTLKPGVALSSSGSPPCIQKTPA
jgi:hypothetical protein